MKHSLLFHAWGELITGIGLGCVLAFLLLCGVLWWAASGKGRKAQTAKMEWYQDRNLRELRRRNEIGEQIVTALQKIGVLLAGMAEEGPVTDPSGPEVKAVAVKVVDVNACICGGCADVHGHDPTPAEMMALARQAAQERKEGV